MDQLCIAKNPLFVSQTFWKLQHFVTKSNIVHFAFSAETPFRFYMRYNDILFCNAKSAKLHKVVVMVVYNPLK